MLHVQETFVYRKDLDLVGVFQHDFMYAQGYIHIFIKVAYDGYHKRAQPPRLRQGHAGFYPVAPGFVGRGNHYCPAVPAYYYGLSAQFRV